MMIKKITTQLYYHSIRQDSVPELFAMPLPSSGQTEANKANRIAAEGAPSSLLRNPHTGKLWGKATTSKKGRCR